MNQIATSDSKIGVETLTKLMDKIQFSKSDLKKIVLPFWTKFFKEGKKKPQRLSVNLDYEMLQLPAYADAFTQDGEIVSGVRESIPPIRYGAEATFTLLPGHGPKSEYRYKNHGVFLHYIEGNNRTILTVLGLDPMRFLSKAYGYAAGKGGWPTTATNDGPAGLARAVNALRPFCAKIQVDRKVYV